MRRFSALLLCTLFVTAGCSTIQKTTNTIFDTITYPLDFILPNQSNVQKREYDALLARSSITVDGLLDEQAWLHAFWTRDFTQVVRQSLGEETPLPGAEPIEVSVVHEKYRIIVAFRGREKLVSTPYTTTAEEDQPLWEGDSVGVLVDADRNETNVRAFYLNPFNVLTDLNLISVGADGDPGPWRANALWKGQEVRTGVNLKEVTDDETGETWSEWTCEIALPVKALSVDQTEITADSVWHIQFVRTNVLEEGQPAEVTLWSPARLYFRPSTYGIMRFP
ncbi:MAG: hypothetical protein QM518_00110 [Verrucomicrobiota bacterium]|jgi:hypothetical protein|nr:hypothetical protein [Verrucomicrobiota bacterium]